MLPRFPGEANARELYGVPGSHPTKAAELMRRQKAIPYPVSTCRRSCHRALRHLRDEGDG
jgi:hypothetical protein